MILILSLNGCTFRFCHAQYADLDDRIHDFVREPAHQPWTIEEYEAHEVQEESSGGEVGVEMAEEELTLFNEYDEPLSDSDDETGDNSEVDEDDPRVNYGLRRKCVFNPLQAFHCVTSMPPDSMHDLMEGIAKLSPRSS